MNQNRARLLPMIAVLLLGSLLLGGCGTNVPTSGAVSAFDTDSFGEEISEEEIPPVSSEGILASETEDGESSAVSEGAEASEAVDSEKESGSDAASASASSVSDTSGESEKTSEKLPVVTEWGSDYSHLRISELMVRSTLYRNESGEVSDWIELYNGGKQPLRLEGLTLSGGKKITGKIDAGGYAVIFVSLPRTGEISLSRGGKLLDRVVLPTDPALGKDFSFARDGAQNGGLYQSVGADGFVCTTLATPGYPNTLEGYGDYCAAVDHPTGLTIKEVVTSNVDDSRVASDGERYDWVLLENRGSASISLADYRLSDGDDYAAAASLPNETLAPGKTVRIFCGGDAGKSGSRILPFKLSDDGERLYLFDKKGKLRDGCILYAIPTGGSYGRMDGKDGFFYFPTAGKQSGGCRAVTPTPVPTLTPGLYRSAQSVSLRSEGVAYYTLDGRKPGKNDPKFSSAIRLEKNCSVRYYALKSGKLPSAVKTAAYLIGESHSLPVAYLSLAPDDMWSKGTGIYHDANRWSGMEREANLSIFDETTGNCSVNCGLSLSGAGSRELDKRSMQMKFRAAYGDGKLHYDIFNDGVTEYDSIKLRVGEDYYSSIFRDELVTTLAGENTAVRYQKYRFCVLYVNGEYFGIFCFRDKLDEQYVARKEGTTVSQVEGLLEYEDKCNFGSNSGWTSLIRFINGNDMKKAENYAVVKEQVNIESLIDWTIAELYAGNRDYGNERKYKCAGGKWTWILYDMDWSFYHHTGSYTLLKNTGSRETGGVVRTLLRNAEFRDSFLTRLSYEVNSVYTVENIDRLCDEMTELLRDEVPRNCRKWGGNADAWLNRVNDIKQFVSVRKKEFFRETVNYFSLTEAEQRKYGFLEGD